MKKILLASLLAFIAASSVFFSCNKNPQTIQPLFNEGATVQRLLDGTTTKQDSINIRMGLVTMMPELFSDSVIGFGKTAWTLQQIGFSNASAAAKWPRTAKRYPSPINVSTMTLDWIAHQEMSYVMEDYILTYCESPGGKYYKFSNTWVLPKVYPANSGRGSLRRFICNGKGSAYKNAGPDQALIFSYPLDQPGAMDALGNQYVFRDMQVIGNNSKLAANTGFKIGANTRPIFENIVIDGCGISADLQFCLETAITNVNISGYGVYGFALRNGLWTGAANSNAQSNVVTISNFRSYNSPGYAPVAAIYLNGNHTIWGNTMTFEGDKGSQSHIFYENTGGTGVNVFCLNNIYMEYAGCTRAGIRIRSGKGQYIINQLRSSIVETDMPCLVEAEGIAVGGNYTTLHVMINNSATPDRNKGKFRAVGNSSYGIKWYVSNYNMKNNTTFNSVDNFDTTMPGSYLPATKDFRFTAPL